MSNATTDHRTPDLDVVVVLFHADPELFRRCVGSVVTAASRAAVVVRLVLVDNGGPVPSVPPLGPSGPGVVRTGTGRNVGFGRAVNAAMEVVRAGRVLLLNPDAELTPDALRAFLRAAERHPRALLAGTVLTDGRLDPDAVIDWDSSVERLVRRWVSRHRVRESVSGAAQGAAVVPVAKASGGALAADAGLLRRLGPFDERFFLYAEDADLSRRARRAGIEVLRVVCAEVHHVGSASARSHAALVEFARADAAVRVTAVHRGHLVSLVQRVELLVVTTLGMALERDRAARSARGARLRALRRWGVRREAPPVGPADLHRG
ncbi:glycosyltransferase [Curtobacterium sp. MCBD17_032]|uniref:glycosyltransferase n=1 Tax=Curtobacterium sp. MCBD17_032 TaxID=2175659 RepID=UPI0015E88014|nr:glycosyltransferase family 2 protein [Curtobacterium sp. MCBD17_032]